jgi:hypothetical protein
MKEYLHKKKSNKRKQCVIDIKNIQRKDEQTLLLLSISMIHVFCCRLNYDHFLALTLFMWGANRRVLCFIIIFGLLEIIYNYRKYYRNLNGKLAIAVE